MVRRVSQTVNDLVAGSGFTFELAGGVISRACLAAGAYSTLVDRCDLAGGVDRSISRPLGAVSLLLI